MNVNVIGSPTVGMYKIISPKKKNSFRVIFCDDTEKQLSYGPQLTNQVIQVSDIIQSSFREMDDIAIIFEDDIDNLCCIALQDMFNESSFMIKIEIIDSNEVVRRTYRLTGCSITEIQHGDLDYTSDDKLTKNVLFAVNGLTIS